MVPGNTSDVFDYWLLFVQRDKVVINCHRSLLSLRAGVFDFCDLPGKRDKMIVGSVSMCNFRKHKVDERDIKLSLLTSGMSVVQKWWMLTQRQM